MFVRKIIFLILNKFDYLNEKLPSIFDKVFDKHLNISKKDKNRIRACVNEIIRLRGILDYLIEIGSKKRINHIDPKIKNILRLGIYELTFDEIVPEFAAIHSSVQLAKTNINRKSSSMVNAVLRNIQRLSGENENWNTSIIEKKIELAYPKWLLKRWKKKYGKELTNNLCVSLVTNKNMYLRLNTARSSINQMVSSLKKNNIKVIQHNEFNLFFKVIFGQQNILDNDLFKRGIISIQDPASGAVVELVDPQEKDFILDVCAAPGTKSLFMAQRVGPYGRITACDNSQGRINKALNDKLRHNQNNIHWHLLDASKDEYPFHEKILIDAPCSGTGVIGRRPDIKWRLKENDIKRLAEVQMSILENTSKYLKPGGKIIYSTCSLESEENEDIINRFLEDRSDFKLLVTNSLLPDRWVNLNGHMFSFPTITNTDGLFAAVLQKKN